MIDKTIVEIKDVNFTYKEGTEASLKDINFNVKEGEIVVLCGKSGCGKSTIIRLINGLIPFYYTGQLLGNIKVLNKNTQDGTIYDLGSKVSTVFQNPKSQFYCVDVKSELAFGAENLGFDKEEIKKRIYDTAHELKIEHLLGRTMFQLSGGEKQKIACASVSVTDNPIVVLDEPSSNLDMYAISELRKMIQYWKQKGKTVIIAEHRLEYLKDLANRFVYMKDGEIEREFSKEEIEKVPPQELREMGLRNLSYDYLEIQNENTAKKFMKINQFLFKYKGSKKANLSIDRLEIPKEAVVAIVGKNGAGKSTFVRCLCGLAKKAKGTLEDEQSNLKAKDRLNNSFLVMQDVNHQLFTEKVEEEILLSMEDKQEQRLEEILKEFDLCAYRNRHPMSLSGGQKQRVAVAGAIASLRNYIIFDEPTSGLDYSHMQQVSECIKDLQEKEKTVFLITHDIELIFSCCNYILWVEDGMVRDLYKMNKENEQRLKKFFKV